MLPAHSSSRRITLGRPEGAQGAVRRRPLRELVVEDGWGRPARWAVDPPGTESTVFVWAFCVSTIALWHANALDRVLLAPRRRLSKLRHT
jgi:hypothetical protein